MNNANFEFNMNQANPWAKMSIGAKVATVLVGLAVAAASLAASVFLAGAALFAALVMMIYGSLSGKKTAAEESGSSDKTEAVIIEGEVTETART